ncbi:hypothetical protein oki361_17440 [Helicobacter pylori]
MDNQRKLTKNLSIAGLILHVLSFIAGIIVLCLFIRQILASANSTTTEEAYDKLIEFFSRYLFFVLIIGAMGIASFVILIILAVKTTSIGNRILFIIGIFIGLCAFIGYILELSRKSNVSSNQGNPQSPNNSNNTTNMPTY